MSFPLPLDPGFRREVVGQWLDDVIDRLEMGEVEDALVSWKIANSIYLNLPPGEGCLEQEARLHGLRVKINQQQSN